MTMEPMNFNDIEEKGYTKIKNHGMIANNRTAALVSMNGNVDWLCLPNFSSDPAFDSILDKNKGGFFSTRPHDLEGVSVKQEYEKRTMVLKTSFYKNEKEILRLTDFLPATEYPSINFPEMHRLVESSETKIEVDILLKATLDYRISPVNITIMEGGAVYRKNSRKIGIFTNAELTSENEVIKGKLYMSEHQREWVVIAYNMSDETLSNFKSDDRLKDTIDYWRNFTNKSNYNGIMKDVALRSGITLRGLFYDPSGMMVASPTSSLPECLGGERNWDYRYSWVRDTSYVIEALSMLGLKEAATNYLYDMMKIIETSDEINVLYKLEATDKLEEYELDYEGYMGSSPVRMGNLASKQFQLDVYGSIINAVFHLGDIGGTVTAYMWDFVVKVVDKIEHIWQSPDSSIWEFRTPRKHYVYSKVMCWLGIDRAIQLGKRKDFLSNFDHWEHLKDIIKKDILENGVDPETGSLVQYYGAKDVDASLLRVSLTGFLDSNDPIIHNTVNRIKKELMGRDYLIKRYNNDDGLSCPDNAFLLMSFWYVEVLIDQNKVDEAKDVLTSLLSKGNHLKLFSEEIDMKTLEPIGNFPQAITHLGVIRAICKLDKKLKNN